MLFKDGGQRKQASLASDSYSYCKLVTITKQNYSCKLKSQSSKFPCVSNMGQSATLPQTAFVYLGDITRSSVCRVVFFLPVISDSGVSYL